MLKSGFFWIGGGVLLVLIGVMGLSSLLLSGMADVGTANYAPSAQMIQATALPTQAAPGRVADDASSGEVALVTEEDADGAAPAQERIILRNANLSLIVEDTAATISRIAALANDSGGWVVTSNTRANTSSGGTYTTGNITVRVPAAGLDDALATIREGALEVTNEQVIGRDVTEEYVDLSSRLRNLKATEDQLAEIMESAYTVEDVLAVQNELTRVRGDIESIEGRLRYFDEAAAFSLVRVDLRERVPAIGEVQVDYWNPGDTVQTGVGALVVVAQTVTDGVILLAIVGGPILLVVGGVIWGGWRMWRRGRREASPAS